MPKKTKPKAVCDRDTPLTPITTKERRKLDKSIKKKYARFRRRYPEVHGKVVDFITHSIEEGFDDARLDTLFLAMPVSWKGTLQQYVGRLHRLRANKKEVLVYDYSDLLVPMLARMYKKRLAGYSALGYVVAAGPGT